MPDRCRSAVGALAAAALLLASLPAALAQSSTPTVATAGAAAPAVTAAPAATGSATSAAPEAGVSVAPVVPPQSPTLGNTIPGSSSGAPITVTAKIVEPPQPAPAPVPQAAPAAAADETASITAPKAAAAGTATATAPKPAVAAMGKLKNCVRLGFSVNDYGKEGPTKDAISLFEKFVPKWAEFNKIKTYKVGKQDVSCKLFLDFIVFDEHTCRAEADVCWNGAPKPEDTDCPDGSDCE